MKEPDYTANITVNATAEAAFHSINHIAGWWTTVIEGRSEKPDDIFTVRFGETYITIRITEMVPYEKISWHVIDCNKHWLKDKKEWKDTTMTWEIAAEKEGTYIRFTHRGLVPGIECYNGCEKAWNFYVQQSLLQLLTKGNGLPELK